MGNKRLKKREHSLKGLGRRGLSLLMAMVMTLSLVQISAFAEEDVAENQPDPLKPETVKNVNDHGIDLTKTAERVGDTEWEVTVRADIGGTKIKQQPLDVVFVLDKSGSMMYCTDPDHDKGSHEHKENDDALYDGIYYKHTGNAHLWGHPDEEYTWKDGYFRPHKDKFIYSACPDYTPCTQKEGRHKVKGGRHDATDWLPCQYKDENGNWVNYETRLESAKAAMTALEKSLPAGANVQYVSFSSNAQQETSLNDVVANGGTNIMKGVDLGIDLLNQNQSTVTKKVLVLLSDGKDDDGNYSSDKLTNFNGDVYTVGFATNNPELRGMIKGDGEYIYAKNTEALNSAFTELSTRISAMIVDPMGNDVTYVSGSAKDGPKENENFETVKGNITLDSDGRTLRWTPMDTDSFSNTVIQYTYRVQLNPSKDAGNYTGIKLNNPTYLQYGIEQNGNKTAYTGQFNIPEGFYKVSTLEEQFKVLDENGNASEITDSVQKPNAFQSKVTDNGDTTLDVYAPIQALDTSDAHMKYVYQYSKLDDDDDIINAKDAEGNITLEYKAPYSDNTMDVTNDDRPHTLVHYYAKEYVNSVEYVYDNDFEDLHPNMDLPEKRWFEKDSVQTRIENPEDDKYNFSGWSTEDVTVDKDGKFTLNTDVTFHGSWEIKPSYQVQANYFTVVDGEPAEQNNKNGPILLEGPIYTNDEEAKYTVATEDMTYSGNTYTEVQSGQGNPAGVEVNGRNVTGIKPAAETKDATITVNIYRYVKSPAYYTVTHRYFNVTPDSIETEVTKDSYTTDRIEGVNDQTVKADSITPDTKGGEYEVGARSEDIVLDKNVEKNITLTYRHYQYSVTVTGDDGVKKDNTLIGAGTYDKGKNAQVGFTLNEGYQVKSVTDNGVDVTDKAKDGTYNISKIDKNHTVVVTTEKIKYTLTVQYIFYDGQKPTTGFENYTKSLDYGTQYDSHVIHKAAPAGYDRTDSGNTTGVITGDTTVLFLYVPKGNATVTVYYQVEDSHMYLLNPKSQSGRIDTSFDVSSWKIDSITEKGKIYDLVEGTEHGKDAKMTGTYQEKGTNIHLYYRERTKANITIKYQSEDTSKATFAKDDCTTQGYLKTKYDVSGTTYIPEEISEKLADGSTRTWYYSGANQLVFNGAHKELKGDVLEGDFTVTAKYYLKPTYSVTATYTTVSNGSSSVQTDATGKLVGEVGQTVPFDLNTYEVKYGFTSSNYQNDLAVNGKPAGEMPQMEKFGDYAVTLSYKKSVNSGVSTTIKHEFQTFLDGVKILDTTTAPDDAVTETWGNTVDMSKFSKAGQAGYEGYTVKEYSTPDGKLRAGDIGTITYVRNLVSVVFDLNGGTWNKSLNNVEYNVAKGTGLNSQQPVPQPEKSGFKFAGWTAQPSNATINGTFDQRTVFTAKWEQDTVVATTYFYTVTYNYTVTTDGTVTYQDSETTEVRDTTKASQTINASATASHGGYTFDLASPAEQTADLTGTTREAPHKFVVNYTLTVNNNGGGGRDDRDDDRPAPKPDPDTEIKDDDVPKSDLPEQPVEIPDEDTPKADLPQAPVDIPDEDTPKADVPKTGDAMGLWVMAAVASGAGLVWLNLTGKKRKDDNG